MHDRTTAHRVTGIVAGLEALTLIGYAVSIAAVALTQGINGPQEVSSPAGVAVEVAVFLAFGAGLVLIAFGRWHDRSWSTVPFVVVQVLALTVGIPLVFGGGGSLPAGLATTVVALVGLAALARAAVLGTDAPVDLRADQSRRSPAAATPRQRSRNHL